ncbi:MAG: CHASE2 domain-containing protein, partial [Magnetococcales bacterium]|nr:CHASE2 domain-containing protein [Magnetococcales bacterium]
MAESDHQKDAEQENTGTVQESDDGATMGIWGRFNPWEVLLAILFICLALLSSQRGWFSFLEDQTLGFRHLLRQSHGDPQATTFSNQIVMITTDEVFYDEYGGYPIRRRDIGKIAKNLADLGARVTVVTMMLDFPSSHGEDPALAALLEEAGNVVLASEVETDEQGRLHLNRPTATLEAVTTSGYVNIDSDSRLFPTFSRQGVYPQITGERGGWP